MPVVSVVIPCYRQALFLPEAIESALAQTHLRTAVVVVDDGSPDETAEVVGRYPEVKCVRQENRGLAGARNAGFQASEGEYIIFLDADDRLTSNAVEAHLECFATNPEAGFVVGDIDHIRPDGSYDGSPRWPLLEKDFYEELLRVNHVANTIAVMFRRSVLDHVGGFKADCSPAEDYALLLHAAQCFPSAHHRTVVAHYRRHPSSLSRQGSVMLRAMDRVMTMQWVKVEGDPRLMKAWRTGDLYWRDHFGIATVKELGRSLARLDCPRVVVAMTALARYVRGRIFLLPWRHRGRLFKIVRRGLNKLGDRSNQIRNVGVHR